MGWKDYFYFQNKDKTAIILLLILIAISGGVYIITYNKTKTVSYVMDEKQAQEFNSFIDSLKEKEATNLNNTYSPSSSSANYNSHYPKKLANGETIELNNADTTDLKKIPKIGSGFANRIVKYRESLGGYHNIAQLKEVWGMDEYLYNDILPYITLTPSIKKLNINTATFQELNKHPYINYKQAQIITDIRERKGDIKSIKRLSLLDEFTDKDLSRLTPYITFD